MNLPDHSNRTRKNRQHTETPAPERIGLITGDSCSKSAKISIFRAISVPSFLTIVLFSLPAVSFDANAQTRSNSPYSRYGIGELHGSFLAGNLGAGDIAAALRSAGNINPFNPASYTGLKGTIFEFGMMSNISRQMTASTEGSPNNSTSFSHFAMGYPVTKRWGGSFGLLPFSSVGYSMQEEAEVPGVGSTIYRFDGTGGINRLYLGNAFRFGSLSAGINISWFFGKIDRTRLDLLPADSAFFNSSAASRLTVGDFAWDAGLQYEHRFGRDSARADSAVTLTLGAAFIPQSRFSRTEEEVLIEMLNKAGNVLDTAKHSTEKASILMPAGWNIGALLSRNSPGGEWLAGIDYSSRSWSGLTIAGVNGELADTRKLSVGGMYRRRPTAVQVQAGLYLSSTYYELHGRQLTENGISFGLRIPVLSTDKYHAARSIFNHINFGFTIGERGTTEDNLVKEQFMRFTFGITFRDLTWFSKRKWD